MNKIFYSVILVSTLFAELNGQDVEYPQSDTTVVQNSTDPIIDDSSAAKPTLNINLWTGLISNGTFGIHPLISVSAGIGSPSNYFILEYEHRYGPSQNNYQIIDDGAVRTVNDYNSSYFGIGYQRTLVPDKEYYALIGIGTDWFEVKKSAVIKNDKTFSGLAMHIGLGSTFYFEAKHGPSIQLLYHYADIANNNGTTFNHGSLMVRLTYFIGRDI